MKRILALLVISLLCSFMATTQAVSVDNDIGYSYVFQIQTSVDQVTEAVIEADDCAPFMVNSITMPDKPLISDEPILTALRYDDAYHRQSWQSVCSYTNDGTVLTKYPSYKGNTLLYSHSSGGISL